MPETCQLCEIEMLRFGEEHAYVRYDNNSLNPARVLVVPHRHVARSSDSTWEEMTAVLALLDRAKSAIDRQHSPDGYNIGVDINRAGGQNRLHVHLIPRYDGDVRDHSGGIQRAQSMTTVP